MTMVLQLYFMCCQKGPWTDTMASQATGLWNVVSQKFKGSGFFSSVSLLSLFYSFWSVTNGSRAIISACLPRNGPRGCFRSECCTGGESVVAPFLAPTHQRQARGWIRRKYRFSSLRHDRPEIEASQPALLACVQSTVPLRWSSFIIPQMKVALSR